MDFLLETSNIVYETEINYASLMKAVGFSELSEMESNGEVIYEAANFKAFFTKIKEFFTNILNKIANLFKKIMNAIKDWFMSKAMKAFANSEAFKNLKAVPKNFKYFGFNFTSPEIMKYLGEPARCVASTDLFKNSNGALEWNNLSGAHENKDPDFMKRIENPEIFYKEQIEGRKQWISDANNPDTRKKTIAQMRCYMTISEPSEIEKFDNWDKFLFSFFRNGKSKPEEIPAKDIDLGEYKSFLADGYSKCKSAADEAYKKQKGTVDKIIFEFQNQLKGIEVSYGSNTSWIWGGKIPGKFKDVGNGKDTVYSIAAGMVNAVTYYFKQYVQDVNSIHVANIKALLDQAKQYKGAITKMMIVPKENESGNKDAFTFRKSLPSSSTSQKESSEYANNILDTIIFE